MKKNTKDEEKYIKHLNQYRVLTDVVQYRVIKYNKKGFVTLFLVHLNVQNRDKYICICATSDVHHSEKQP